jgi:Tfp pilus assembly protein PilV
MLRKSTPRRSSLAGFTLVENIMACAIIAVGMAGTYTLNGQAMSILRMGRDQACASQVLQQRIEHLRIANWQRITNRTWIRDAILDAPADGSSELSGLTETVTVSPFAGVGGANTFTRAGSTASAGNNNVSLIANDGVIVKWRVTWKGAPASRIHTRETLAVLAKGGVAK